MNQFGVGLSRLLNKIEARNSAVNCEHVLGCVTEMEFGDTKCKPELHDRGAHPYAICVAQERGHHLWTGHDVAFA